MVLEGVVVMRSSAAGNNGRRRGSAEELPPATLSAAANISGASTFFLAGGDGAAGEEHMLSFGSHEGGWGASGLWPAAKGAFTPAQWLELEQQAMIFKHLVAKSPVPPSLIFPIRRSLMAASPANYYGSSSAYGWGCYQLGFAGAGGDLEHGRCRRTDGKKWRCSRDAVGDQKYCERHMNRGRHRSRKHVEGQQGHAAKIKPAASAAAAASEDGGIPSPIFAVPGACSAQFSRENADASADPSASWGSLSTVVAKEDGLLEVINPVCKDPVPNCSVNMASSTDVFSAGDGNGANTLEYLIDGWPPGGSSASPSPQLACDSGSQDPLAMFREAALNGPLGEVLNKNGGRPAGRSDCSPPLSLRVWTDGWDLSPGMASPTDVLQKAAFGSVSSSTGSSPRPESCYRAYDGGDDLGLIFASIKN